MPAKPVSPTLYWVFQRRCQPGLCCAVRETMSLPNFVRPGDWIFGATVREDDSLPFGFLPAPAREATETLGYYVFHHPCETLAPRYSRRWA